MIEKNLDKSVKRPTGNIEKRHS